MIITRHKVDAGEAMNLGIVSAVVSRDEIIEKAIIKAEEKTSVSPHAICTTNRVLNSLMREEHFPESLAYN